MTVVPLLTAHHLQIPENDPNIGSIVVFFHPAPDGVVYHPNNYEIAFHSYNLPHPDGVIPFHSEVDQFVLQSASRGRRTGARHPLVKRNGARAARIANYGTSTIYVELQ